MTVKTRYTAENIMCRPVDRDKLNEAVNTYFGGTAKVSYHVAYGMAVIDSPKPAIIDKEFVGCDIGKEVTFSVWTTENNDNGSYTGHCIPEHQIILTLAELQEYLMPEVTLAEFTKNRRGYNSRIIGNEQAWMHHFNS